MIFLKAFKKIHYWENEIKQMEKKNKFADYIQASKKNNWNIKTELSMKNNQTHYACKGDLFFIRTHILRKGIF